MYKEVLQQKTQTNITTDCVFDFNPLNLNTKYFSEVNTFYHESRPTQNKGVLKHYNLIELTERLNNYKKPTEGTKLSLPAILKGIYKGGIKGEFCQIEAPFLPLDIDVKQTENQVLFSDAVLNENIFQYLKSIMPIVWRSNSQKGIAGFIYVPQFENGNFKENTILHKQIANKIYNKIEDLIFDNFNVKIKLDPAQGAFRQIRYLAEQKEVRTINNKIKAFKYEVKEVKVKTIENVPVFNKPTHINNGSIKDQFNQNNNIENILRDLNFDIIGNRAKYYKSESSTSGEIKKQSNVFVNYSGSLANDINSYKRELTPFDLVCGLRYNKRYYDFLDDLKKQGYEDIKPTKTQKKSSVNTLKNVFNTVKDTDVIANVIMAECYKIHNDTKEAKKQFIKEVNPPAYYKKYFYEYLGLNHSSIVIYAENLKAERYVSECIKDLVNVIDTNNKVLIKAETGTGKTTAIIKDFRKIKPDARCLLLAPLTIIVDQLRLKYKGENISFLTGSSSFSDHRKAMNSSFIVATYEQGVKHLKDKNNKFDYVFIDEAHQLINANSYKADVIKNLTKELNRADFKIIGLTGTPNRLFADIGFYMINIDFKSVLPVNVNVRYSNAEPLEIVLNHINFGARCIFRINDINALDEISANLINQGLFTEDEILILHSSKEIKRSKEFRYLYQKSKFHKHIKIVLTTSLIDEGLSINDDFTDSVFISTNHAPEAEPVKQFFARFRNESTRQNYLYLKHTKEPRKDSYYKISEEFKTNKILLEDEYSEAVPDNIRSTYFDFTDSASFINNDNTVNDYYLSNTVLNYYWRYINERQFLEFLKDNYNINTIIDDNWHLNDFDNVIKISNKEKKQNISLHFVKHIKDVEFYLLKHSIDNNLKSKIEPLKDDFIPNKEIENFINKNLKKYEKYYKIYIELKFLKGNIKTILNDEDVFLPDNKIYSALFDLRLENTIKDPILDKDFKNKDKINAVLYELKNLDENACFSLNDFKTMLKKHRIFNFKAYTHETVKRLLRYGNIAFHFDTKIKRYKVVKNAIS